MTFQMLKNEFHCRIMLDNLINRVGHTDVNFSGSSCRKYGFKSHGGGK